MSHLPKALNALSVLLSYPSEHTCQAAELLYVVLGGEHPEAASEAAAFGAYLERHEQYEAEEVFTRTFDVNPACALEVGWHLFGEEYARGMFLVRMREELRKYNIAETSELPDHIAHVLAVVAAMPADEAERFVGACVLPAVEKMRQALDGKDTPYRHAINCLTLSLRHTWPEVVRPVDDAAANVYVPDAPRGDLLRDYPAPISPGDGCGSGGCGSGCGDLPMGDGVELVPITVDRSLTSLPHPLPHPSTAPDCDDRANPAPSTRTSPS